MSIISFGFYVVVAYVAYYILVISYDLLTSNPASGTDTDGNILYEFGDTPKPKLAVIEGEEEMPGGRKQSIDFNETSLSEEVGQENEIAPAVDLALERLPASRVNVKRHN
jgi:hypothetical protein